LGNLAPVQFKGESATNGSFADLKNTIYALCQKAKMPHLWDSRTIEALNWHFQKERIHQALTPDGGFNVLIIIILILDWNTWNQVPHCSN